MTNGAGFDREEAAASNDAALGLLAGSDRSRIDLLRSLIEVADNASFTTDGATSQTGWLRRRGAMTALEAGRTTRRVNVLRRLPAFADLLFADLLFAGETTVGHLDALAEVATERRQEAFDQ
jgi:hypothetical protein